jgi:hypothetical protein
VHQQISSGVDRGLSGGSSVPRPRIRDPHQRQWKFYLQNQPAFTSQQSTALKRNSLCVDFPILIVSEMLLGCSSLLASCMEKLGVGGIHKKCVIHNWFFKIL